MPRPGYDSVLLVTGYPSLPARRMIEQIITTEPRSLVYTLKTPEPPEALETPLDAPAPELSLSAEQRARVVFLEGTPHAMDLGLSGAEFRQLAREVDRVHHLAHVGSSAVDRRTAHTINVVGAAEILEFSRAASHLKCLVFHSTAHVSGDRTGVVYEEDLDRGQSFRSDADETRMRAAVLVDTGFGGPPPNSPEAKRMMEQQVRNIPTGDRAARVYPTEEAALARFRFMPPQVAGNLFIADFIARRSLKRAPLPDGGGEGWTWRFDPAMWNKLDRTVMMGMTAEGPPKVTVPLVHIYGDRSVVKSRISDDRPSPLPRDMLEIAIPDSAHHIMVDQPLALIAALRGLLARWPG